MSSRSPREVVEEYIAAVWNARDVGRARTLISAQTVRHSPGSTRVLSAIDTLERLQRDVIDANSSTWFTTPVVVCEGDLVAAVWNGYLEPRDSAPTVLASIEIFRIRDGQIVEVWNAKEQVGRWDEIDEATASQNGGRGSPEQGE